jgi:hypothetical protein
MWALLEGSLAMALNYGVLLVMALAAVIVTLNILRRTLMFLGKDEQLKVELFTETVVYNGPAIKILNPAGYRKVEFLKATMLGTMDYLKIKDSVTGHERVQKGPDLVFLGPYEQISVRGQGVTLSKTQYVIVENMLSGEKKTVPGPCVWFPAEPHEVAVEGSPNSSFKWAPGQSHGYSQAACGATPNPTVFTAIALQEDEYVRLADTSDGRRWVERGRNLLFLEPTWKVEGSVRKAWTLKAFEYVRLLNSVTGVVRVERGEQIVFPGSDEDLLDGDKLSAIDLNVDEYVKIEDQKTCEVRVVSGTNSVFLGPTERVRDGGKQKAVQVDEEHAVLVRDTSSGQLRLVIERQLFVPGPHEAIEEVQQLIRLADHEAMIVKDKEGNLNFHYGHPDRQTPENPRSFFLQPYSEIVKMLWSSGLRRQRRDLCIERFDCRAQYMWFEFDVRTSDNVELILEVTMFWEVEDLPRLVGSTGNLPGDIYNQARSQFIKEVARVTLKGFMEQLHNISNRVFTQDTGFYQRRGVRIHSLEVTRYKCADPRTSEVLQQIIEETTNRLNRLSKAESENEVSIFRMQGQIEQERLNEELLQIKQQHLRTEAQAAGCAEAERVAAFVRGLAEPVPSLEERIDLWKVLRQTDALSVVSEGGAQLYYTPNDVDLSIGTDPVRSQARRRRREQQQQQ